MDAFKNYIKQYPHYHPNLYSDVLPHLAVKYIDAGAYFLRQGNVARQIAFIEAGLLRLYYLRDGREITKCFCKENTITCSYRSLVTQSVSDISIQAIEPTKLIVFSYDTLKKLYNKDLFWQQVGRLAVENELILSECHHHFLQDLSATERYQQVLEQDRDLLQRVPLNYLATYLQIAPETLSRIRKKLSRN